MNSASIRTILSIAIAIVFSVRSPTTVRAVEHVVALQGEITQVTDELNWFHDSIQVGMPVEGTYNYFDTGYQQLNSPPSESFYQYYFQPNGSGFPVLPAKMGLQLGGMQYETGPGFFFYGIDVINNSDGIGNPGSDAYTVQSPLKFPAHFTDLAGDPDVDPDGNFFPILGMSLKLVDATGNVFSSTALPLSAPGLSGFTSALGTIFIADGNGGPNYAVAEFRITSLQAVPEPASLLLCTASVIAIVGVRWGRVSHTRHGAIRSRLQQLTPVREM